MTATDVPLHPWNTAFAWRPPRPPYSVLDAATAGRFDRDGFVVLHDVLDPDLVAAVVADTDRFAAEIDEVLRAQPDERLMIAERGAITFAVHLVARSPGLRRLAVHPTLVGLCADLVGPDVDVYWDQAVYKEPDKPRRFPWHQDNGYAFVEPQQYLTCWVALTDATPDNGCPWVVPGVHRRGTLRHRYVEPLGWECFADPPGARPVPVEAGGVVVFSSLTPHLTGPNTSGATRKSYILQYAPAGARVLTGDPGSGPPTGAEPCGGSDRQFPVLRDGRPAVDRTGT